MSCLIADFLPRVKLPYKVLIISTLNLFWRSLGRFARREHQISGIIRRGTQRNGAISNWRPTVLKLAATRPTEEEIVFDPPEQFFDELERLQCRVPELPLAGREISRGVSHWHCPEGLDLNGYPPAEGR